MKGGAVQNHIHDFMEDYLTGQLDLKSQRTFRQHIAGCRSCANALKDVTQANAYLQRLHPIEAPPVPGPQFYLKVQQSIEKKLDTGWFGSFAAVLQGPRLAFPLLFLFLGLLLSAWTMMTTADWDAEGIMGIPPRRFSQTIASDTDRDMVMVSLVDGIESQ